MAPGEAATPLAAPLGTGLLGRVSPSRMNKTMIWRTTAGITTPLRVARSHGALSPSEYEAQRNAIFSTGAAEGYMASGAGWGANMPHPPHGGQLTLSLAQGTAGPPDLTAQDGGGHNQVQLPSVAHPQQGAAQIAVQPAAGIGTPGGGTAPPPTGTGPTGTPPQDFSGIASALQRLAPLMTDADTARNLRWQREVDGDKNNIAAWKHEATGSAGLQFYAYMQPGEAFLVLGHSLSCINSTTMDIASFHGKVILFIGDRTHTRECVPVILPSPAAFSWIKCPVVEDKTKLADWYADNRSEYGSYGTLCPATELESRTMSPSYSPFLYGR